MHLSTLFPTFSPSHVPIFLSSRIVRCWTRTTSILAHCKSPQCASHSYPFTPRYCLCRLPIPACRRSLIPYRRLYAVDSNEKKVGSWSVLDSSLFQVSPACDDEAVTHTSAVLKNYEEKVNSFATSTAVKHMRERALARGKYSTSFISNTARPLLVPFYCSRIRYGRNHLPGAAEMGRDPRRCLFLADDGRRLAS